MALPHMVAEQQQIKICFCATAS